MNKKQKKAKLTLDIIACALSAVSAGLSIAAFVISLAMAEGPKIPCPRKGHV